MSLKSCWNLCILFAQKLQTIKLFLEVVFCLSPFFWLDTIPNNFISCGIEVQKFGEDVDEVLQICNFMLPNFFAVS